MRHENFLSHAIFLKSEFNNFDGINTLPQNQHTLVKLLNYIDFNIDDKPVDMNTVEKIIYHYVMNDFSRTPYDNFNGFNCNAFQNPEDVNAPIEEIKYAIAYACCLYTGNFNKEVIEKHKDFDLKFIWKK